MIRRGASPAEYSNKEPVPPSHLGSLFSMLASHPSCGIFQCLKVYVQPFQAPCALSQTILPLLTLPALCKLELYGWSLIVVDATTIAAMSYAWPLLKQLILHHPKPVRDLHNMDLFEDEISATPWEATLTDLLPLATRCRLLETIALSVNTWPDIDAPVPPVRTEDSALTRLYVGYGAEPGAGVAAFLSAVFPRLESVGNAYYNYEDGFENRDRSAAWRYVMDIIPALRAVRVQERSWAAQQRLSGD